MVMDKSRPDRIELFAFYYLGINPDGEYRFANAHHVGKYYSVSADAVMRWLDELDLKSSDVLRQRFNLSGPQLELQLDLPNLDPAGVRERAAVILAELDDAEGGRRFWEDN